MDPSLYTIGFIGGLPHTIEMLTKMSWTGECTIDVISEYPMEGENAMSLKYRSMTARRLEISVASMSEVIQDGGGKVQPSK